MTVQELKNLVKRGENATLEFKRKASHPEKILKEVVAFANTRGGELLIGVDDNGEIPGVKFVEDETYAMRKALETGCKPRIPYREEIIALSENRSVIRYIIEEGLKKPYYVKPFNGEMHGKTYVRVNDQSIQASREVREIMRRDRRRRNIMFHYGEKERVLMEYLDKHSNITLAKYADLTRQSRFKASRTLVLLTLANVLEILPREKEDLYSLKAG